MRRPLIMLPAVAALAALAAFGALGCEDGPTQTFQAAPPNAGNEWNGQNVPPAVQDGGQAYDAGYPTISKLVLCSTDFKRERWAWMLTQPISPPRMYAGIDMAKDNQWDGLTIEDAEAAPATPTSTTGGLCQSTPFGFEGQCPSGIGNCNLNSWGNNNEVLFSWNVATHVLDQMELQLGYVGPMTTNVYPDHTGALHAYRITIGDVIRRSDATQTDYQPFEIDWAGPAAGYQAQITDIFNATMATFSGNAGVPFDTSMCTDDSTCNAPGTYSSCQCTHQKGSTACVAGQMGQCGITNCGTDGNCLIENTGANTYFGIRPMVVYIVGTAGVPQPALSTPTLIYNFFTKWEPYSNLPQTVKLDANGPLAQGIPQGVGMANMNTVCSQQIGQTFSDLQKNCVEVHGDASNPDGIDATNLNKITHSLTHDQEHWTANVLGCNQNFTSLAVINGNSCTPPGGSQPCTAGTESVVLDTDQPQPTDIAQDFTFDVRARGATWNDYGPYTLGQPPPAQPVLEARGSAMLFMQWAHLLLLDINRILTAQNAALGLPPAQLKTIGDPSCIGFGNNGEPNYIATNANATTYGCSGIEGILVPNGNPYYNPSGGASVSFTGDYCYGNTPDIDPGVNLDQVGIYSSVLKPGDITGAFCIDPVAAPALPTDCDSSFSIWENALLHVSRVLGGGVLTNLPAELQDRRYYFKWFGVAYIQYLKAYGNYGAQYPATLNQFPVGNTAGGGLGPCTVRAQQIDLESMFFDYLGAAGSTFDKFEYIDRDFIGQGNGGVYNVIPWDFEYGSDIFAGNQRYDNWYRRMDREEIAMYSSMLVNKSDVAGQENNVNITNLFGSILLGGNPAAGVAGAFPSYLCAIGRAGDPNANCNGVNAPLDPTLPSNPDACGSGTNASGCNGTQVCAGGNSYENGVVVACGDICDFTTYPASGCKSPTQTCAAGTGVEGCIDQMMDKNGPSSYGIGINPQPLLYEYAGAWQQTPFSRGHSPITMPAANQFPDIGVAKINIPNYVVDPTLDPSVTGPYTISPIPLGTATSCPSGYTKSANGVWCNAATSNGTGTLAPGFQPLVPFFSPQPGVGFSIPLDAQHNQWVATGQMDFTGVLETYVVDYLPYVDPNQSSCVTTGTCNPGFVCQAGSNDCVTNDDTLQIAAIEGADFLGQAFVCQDPYTLDILHVGMYDSAISIMNWFAAHPGAQLSYGVYPSAQAACQVLIIRTAYDNYVNYIVSKQYGVALNMGGGQGQGRVTDIVLFDPGLIQAL